MKTYKIAIDGPAGVGKSTIAKRLASLFHFTYVDTGAMYRTIALYYIEKRLPLENEEVVLSHLNDIVREKLVKLQREIGEKQNVVMDGRDIGTKVFPDADVKLFLTATCEERAKRRMAEMREKGMQASYDEILESIRFRDENDSNRKIDPLKPASDAIMVDNTQDTLEQTVERIKNIIKERLK